MIAQMLLDQLNTAMFEGLELDHILDQREDEAFDQEWSRVYREVEELKREKGYPEEAEQLCGQIRKEAYLSVYKAYPDSDLAAYVSDDFGLICDSEQLGYEDRWLDALIKAYEEGTIPCGKLAV